MVCQGLSRFIKVYYLNIMGDHHFMAMAIWGVPKFQSSHIVSFDFRRIFVTLCRCDKSFEYSFFPSRFMQQCRVRIYGIEVVMGGIYFGLDTDGIDF